jgi:transcriptional regulator with XRE-family HTH domain
MVKQLRADYGLSQKEFAKGLGISPQYLCDIEAARRLPSVKLVKRLNDYCGHMHVSALRAWHTAAARAHGWDI